MTGRRFLQYSLVLPVVAPVLALAVAPTLGFMLAMGLFLASVPYVVFSIWAWRRLSRMATYDEARTLLAIAPIILGGITALAWVVLGGFEAGAFIFAGEVLLFAIPIGYGYVALAGLLLGAAHVLGLVSEFAPSARSGPAELSPN